jgi:hypothetical protein
MTLDEPMLEKARAQAAHVEEAERQALLARADYHAAVRRLHLAGGSLREIAEALGLSHQRVQQIVQDAGGSWWQRVWRSRTVRRDAVCTFCGRPPSEVAKLIAGPNVYICDACVARCEKSAPSKSVTARCSFCGKRKSARRALIVTRQANICGECLRSCRQILNDRAA